MSTSRLFSKVASATSHTADVVIVGGGVIGCSIALNLARRGRKVAVVDTNAGAGQGSTSYSSGICRPFYSLLDSVKFAYEGYSYWRDWEEYIGVHDSRGYAKLRPCGGLVLKSKLSEVFLGKCLPLFDELGIPYEEWDQQELEERMGARSRFGMDLRYFGPPKRIDHEDFGSPAADGTCIEGAVFVPETGYVSDPQLGTANMQFAAEETGNAKFIWKRRVTAIAKGAISGGGDGRVTGVELDGGAERIVAPVVINAAGPHSSQVTAMAYGSTAAAAADMRVTTRPLRQEVAYLPGRGWGGGDREDGARSGPVVTDFDTGAYFRPEVGDKVLVGGLEPECDHPLQYCSAPEDANPSLTEEHTNLLYRCSLRLPNLPLGFGAGGTQGIVACYDVTEDWTPST